MSSQPAQSPAYSAGHSPAHSESAEPKTHCVQGHSRWMFGVDEWGGCNECRRIREKQRKKTTSERKRLARIAEQAKLRPGARKPAKQYCKSGAVQLEVEALNEQILLLIDKHELSSAAEWREIKAQIAVLTKAKDKLERGEA